MGARHRRIGGHRHGVRPRARGAERQPGPGGAAGRSARSARRGAAREARREDARRPGGPRARRRGRTAARMGARPRNRRPGQQRRLQHGRALRAGPAREDPGDDPRQLPRGRGAHARLSPRDAGPVAGYQPLGFAATYGATKAFDLMLGEALWAENRSTGVDVLALSPGPVDTEFQAVAGEKPHPGATPESVVETAFAALGKKPSVIVGGINKARTWSLRLAPRKQVARLAMGVMRGYIPEERR